MEDEPKSTIPQKYLAHKLCKKAISYVLIGIFLAVSCLFIGYMTRYNPDKLILFGGFLVSFALIYFVGPIFGIYAIVEVIANKKIVFSLASDVFGREQIHLTAKRFVTASLLFSSTALLPVVCWLFSKPTRNIIMPFLFSICFLLVALIALMMAIIPFRLLKRISANIPVRISSVSSVFLGLIAVVAVLISSSYGNYIIQRVKYSKITPTFSGNSDLLRRTLVVPTLDSPIEENKNIIWCSSFQLAWNVLKDNVVKGPVEIAGAQKIADFLNKTRASRDDLDASSYFVAAGLARNGADKYIQTEMARKFPGESIPSFGDLEPLDLIVYAFLTAQAKFKYPFENYENGISFEDSNDSASKVAAFGVWEDKKRFDKQRSQIDILYQAPLPELEPSSEESIENYRKNRISHFLDMEEFAVDLCKHTEPYQIIVAKIEPKSTLELTLRDLQVRISDFSRRYDYNDLRVFHKGDELSVPEMYWKVDHTLEELEGKFVSNAGPSPYLIRRANQIIQFRLDRYGAVLKSEAKLIVLFGKLPGRNFSFNKPFLLYMKKRDCEQPFFVMWVDNAELLNKK